MPAQISISKRDDIYRRVLEGETPNAIALGVGVSRRTASNYRRKLQESGGIPPVSEVQAAGRPAALDYINGDDQAVDDLLSQMDIKAQAETMHTLVRARNLYQEDRSVDVGVFAGFLRHSAELLAALGGPLEAWADPA